MQGLCALGSFTAYEVLEQVLSSMCCTLGVYVEFTHPVLSLTYRVPGALNVG